MNPDQTLLQTVIWTPVTVAEDGTVTPAGAPITVSQRVLYRAYAEAAVRVGLQEIRAQRMGARVVAPRARGQVRDAVNAEAQVVVQADARMQAAEAGLTEFEAALAGIE